MSVSSQLYAGDLVEVKTPEEILQTLDADGTLAQLPFMPEMMQFCGKRFKVARRVLKTCTYDSKSTIREFKADDVILLDGLRCDGAEHDGCQKACTIFWREAWLRRIDDGLSPAPVTFEGAEKLRARLKTAYDSSTYFCQSGELFKVTRPLSRYARLLKCFDEVRVGNCTALDMAQRIGIWILWRIRRKIVGSKYGASNSTPTESLNLSPGEWVEIKSMDSIAATLNRSGLNRGLFFAPDMSRLSGEKRRVERKLEKIIVDGSGKMRHLRNTVFLEGSYCGCAHAALGGCPRDEFAYWREIWLRRSSPCARAPEGDKESAPTL